MKSLPLILVLSVCTAVKASVPFGYSVQLHKKPWYDPKSRCLRMSMQIKNAESVVFSELPPGWSVQVLTGAENELDVIYTIWPHEDLEKGAANARFAVPADRLLASLWIKARPQKPNRDSDYNEPMPVMIDGNMGILGDRADWKLENESFEKRFGIRSWPNQALEPMSLLVMPSADAEVTPSKAMAHLER